MDKFSDSFHGALRTHYVKVSRIRKRELGWHQLVE